MSEPAPPTPPVGEPEVVAGGRLCARLVDQADSLHAEAFERLRHGYFVRQRGWVAEDSGRPGRERDRYDAFSLHLGVFRSDRLVAYLRALPWQPGCGFMLEREFRVLLPEGACAELILPHTVELTRLVMAPRSELALREVPLASELLFRLFYQEAQRQGWQHLYIVVEAAWLLLFERRFGFRFEPLSCPQTFPDGTRTVAARARLADLEDGLAQNCPGKLDWYREP